MTDNAVLIILAFIGMFSFGYHREPLWKLAIFYFILHVALNIK